MPPSRLVSSAASSSRALSLYRSLLRAARSLPSQQDRESLEAETKQRFRAEREKKRGESSGGGAGDGGKGGSGVGDVVGVGRYRFWRRALGERLLAFRGRHVRWHPPGAELALSWRRRRRRRRRSTRSAFARCALAGLPAGGGRGGPLGRSRGGEGQRPVVRDGDAHRPRRRRLLFRRLLPPPSNADALWPPRR